MNKDKKSKKVNVLSLFSGIGGLDMGFEKADFNIVATVDFDHDCCETQKINAKKYLSSDTKIIEADITKIQPNQIYKGKVDFIIGGPPCQTFSAIGRRAGGAMGTLDARGNLFKHYCRLLKSYNPKGFLFENVRGILYSNKGEDWKEILKSFEKLGYKLKYRLLDAAGYGVAQHRERVILVGYKEKEFFYPQPIFGPDSSTKRAYVSPREALKGIKIDKSSLILSGGKYDHLLKDIPEGGNYLYYTKEMGHPNPCFAWRSKFSDFLYKANPDIPVKTIVASMGRYSGPFHWESRKMDISEFKRLQGFPDDFILMGSKVSQMKQIGNSVVPPFGYQLALAVKKTIFNEDLNLSLMPDNFKLTIDKRKGIKARNTRKIAISNKSNHVIELPFFNPTDNKEENLTRKVEYLNYYKEKCLIEGIKKPESWKVESHINEKMINLVLSKNNRHSDKKIGIKLNFYSGTLGGIKTISVITNTSIDNELFVLWDALNGIISRVSNYPSVHELYGHFTEPNPKFELEIINDLSGPMTPEMKFMIFFSNFKHVEQLYSIDTIKEFGFNHSEPERNWLERMRKMRFDVRTNLTNKTIPKGKYRVCYPYTLPYDRKTFVTISKSSL